MVNLASNKYPMVNAMLECGYSLDDLLPAFPGKDNDYLDEMLADNINSLNRPLISYGILSTAPCKSRYFNISKNGFRLNGEDQTWPPDPDKYTIFCFGGSTTLGSGLEDGQSISACIQRLLEKRFPCEVYNFGSNAYTSRQEAMRFLDIIDKGVKPDLAVFIDGYNESYYALGNNQLVYFLNSIYQEEKRRKQYGFLKGILDYSLTMFRNRKNDIRSGYAWKSFEPNISPEDRDKHLSDEAIIKALRNSDKQISIREFDEFQVNIAKTVWERYLDSMSIIRALVQRNNIRTFFIWQPVPFYKVKSKHRLVEKLYCFFRYGVLSQSVYNWLNEMNFPGTECCSDFLNLSDLAENRNDSCYIDIGHYSPAFCQVIAENISKAICNVREL